ncbi:hypothetical protein PM082_015466 [Marasmius tenuissimus]|nr:hypothetical protein PM082_015466 [Marasmius tenuissimus]
MVVLNKFFSSVLLAVLYASFGNAAPSTSSARHTTHRVRSIGSGLKVEAFHPQSDYKTFGAGVNLPPSFAEAGIEDKTVSFIASQLNIDAANLSFKSGYTNDAHEVGYAKQTHDGIPFVNAVANVAFKDKKAVAFGQSFVDISKIADSKPTVDVNTVIPKVEEALQGKKNDIEPTLEYLALEDGSSALVHVFQVQNEEVNSWFEAYVDAHSGELLSVTDFVADATYKVLPVWKEIITEGLEVLADPQNTASSPDGWHTITSPLTTAGNNVVSFKGSQTNTTAEASFQATYNPSQAATVTNNIDAARVNAFYIINTHHDVLYQYGFTEAAFNFQNNNFGKGGAGNDRVIMSVQDSSGTNNANFATPPDGQSGTCRMFIWTLTIPTRDGAIENDIPLHEMTHGLSNRLTGGGTGRCLQTLEAGGMGEGWSDALADWFSHSDSAAITDFIMGQWVTNNPAGIRTRPYSTSAITNPLRYSTIAVLNEVHTIGEVWANILHNVYASLVSEHGFSANARTNANTGEGNVVFLRLLVDALALQPCNPTLPTARDAWIQADANRYGGANRCLLWRTFASRGLGVGAANHIDSTAVPSGC